MNKFTNLLTGIFLLGILIVLTSCSQTEKVAANEWIDLFNGKDLRDWKANENPESFRVEDGVIVANGERSHLFYVGDVNGGNFKNFELSADVMTHSLANSGIYFHTKYQDEGWPSAGYEVQVNNTHVGGGDYREVKKTGSLYMIRNVYKAFAQDSVWFNMNIRVQGKHVQVRVNDLLVVDYVEPASSGRNEGVKDRIISEGTFALQGHDLGSKVLFKNIRVRMLDDVTDQNVPQQEPYPDVMELQTTHMPFIDMNVLPEQVPLDSVIRSFYRSGVNLALVFELSDQEEDVNAALSSRMVPFANYPAFYGLIFSDPSMLEVLDMDMRGQVDFTAFRFTVPNLTQVPGDINAYMDEYVTGIELSLMETQADVFANPIGLPESLLARSGELWTEQRMLKIIKAAKARGMALQIDCAAKSPAIPFVKLAKQNGCTISFANIYNADGVPDVSYAVEVIRQCKLDYKDIYIPDKKGEPFQIPEN